MSVYLGFKVCCLKFDGILNGILISVMHDSGCD